MLFNSYVFIFFFVPITVGVFFLIAGRGRFAPAVVWLTAASLFFYGWWNPIYLGLILTSIGFNYIIGARLHRITQGDISRRRQKIVLALGVAINLGLLGYFKYANFFVDSVNAIFGSDFYLGRIILPLAISFFTFQQIAFLVDAYRGQTRDYSFIDYCLFVSFFPQLIAGPIVHHGETLPQFSRKSFLKFNPENMAVAVTIFSIGLFKKVVLADSIADFSTPVFTAAGSGYELTFCESWMGALAYTFQIYFDFSGYSDMAIGLARMFGVLLPLNFNSPYKSVNFIEFWQRWHMTLSRFLRNYLYIPLGGNRKGRPRQYFNLMITMLLGGLWHGAGWTFIIWGGAHGVLLALNHAWRSVKKRMGSEASDNGKWGRIISGTATFVAVAVLWVIFRAEDMETALQVWQGMFLFNGLRLDAPFANEIIRHTGQGIALLSALSFISIFFPNTQQIMRQYKPTIEAQIDPVPERRQWVSWRPDWRLAMVTGTVMAITLIFLSRTSEFLYFQF